VKRFLAAHSLLVLVTLFLFLLNASAATEKIVHQFNQIPHGSWQNGVVADATGNLYGTTIYGGTYQHGVVFQLSPNAHGGWTESVLYSFTGGSDGSNPYASVTLDATGNIYGTTRFGGLQNDGTVFELTPNGHGGWAETVLHSFTNGPDGFVPLGVLSLDASGNVFGTTTYGGASGYGIAFELTPSSGSWTETILYSFTGGADGGYPGSPVPDASGNLYVSTEIGGAGNGVVAEIAHSGAVWIETVLYQFAGGSDGAEPIDLIFDKSGNLFGTTFVGGTGSSCYSPNQGCGTVFELKVFGAIWHKTTIYNFTNSQPTGVGIYPFLGTFDDAGNLYGETNQGGSHNYCNNGCGSVFKLSPNQSGGWVETTLFNLDGRSAGYYPAGNVVLGARGQIYGSAEIGGSTGLNGTVFALSPSSGGEWNSTTLYSFPYGDGASPFTSLISDGQGNFYGTTSFGGAFDLGAVFKLTPVAPGAWKETLLYSFPSGRLTGVNGVSPSSLIFDGAGNLYGTASFAGPQEFGSVFKLSPSANGAWTEKNLYNFSASRYPMGALVLDKSGNLYGTTNQGGANGFGELFKLSPGAGGAWTETVIHTFQGYPADGANPAAALISDSTGNLYGTTEQGGSSANCKGGAGKLVGCGTVFKLSNSAGVWTESLLYSFTGLSSDGQNPVASLLFDGVGNLYGTTLAGGVNGKCPSSNGSTCGTVFELSPGNGDLWNEKVLYEFTNSAGDGGAPLAALIFDQKGNLYGTTSLGNACPNSGCGTVFELSPMPDGSWAETILYDFNSGFDAHYPAASLIFDAAGNLFGTTAAGGLAGTGTVFEITP
jgi:uncharacterized repeat protein (TIGR03803 family)